MSDLTIIQNNEVVTTSLQVAENFEKNHRNVLKAIDELIERGVAQNVADLFKESTYTHEQNKQEYRMFYINRDGFTLLAMGFSGQKALTWKMKYIESFNKMEQHIKQQKPQSLEVALRAALEHEEQIRTIKSDITLLKGTMRITSLQQQEIQVEVRKVVVKALGGKESPAYAELKGKLFSEFWKEFKNYFKVPRYGDLPTAKFDEAINYLKLWRPNTSMQMEIDSYNSQMAIY